MPNVASVERLRVDACPGALTLHQAADGGLARVRLPGGIVSAAQLEALAAAADDLGDGRLELTSRGNGQLRALAPGAEVGLGQRLAAAGLLPSATHERVRNIVASPLAGIDSAIRLDALIADLDRELCARPRLAELPGRFLFGLDDGRGDVARLDADVLVRITAAGRADVNGVEGPLADAVALALASAEAFLAEREAQGSSAWRIEELRDGAAAVRSRVLERWPARTEAGSAPLAPSPAPPVGAIAQPDGRTALAVLAPLGRLTAAQVRALAALTGPRGARITPWRSVVLPDLRAAATAASALDRAGLGVDAISRWYRLSACTGRPGCAKSLADVQADASAETAAQVAQRSGRTVHWSGCARQCGRPHDTDVDLVATETGYLVTERATSEPRA